MSNQRAKEFHQRFQERLCEVVRRDYPNRTTLTGDELNRATVEALSIHDRLIAEIDESIRRMPPIEIDPDVIPSPDPNELNLSLRMEAQRELRRQRREEKRLQREAMERGNRAVAAKKVDTTEAFVPKRKLDID